MLLSVMLLAGTSLSVFSVMGKIPGLPEEYWYTYLLTYSMLQSPS